MPTPDFQRHMHQHIRVCKRAKYWAEKAVTYAEAGDGKRSRDATKRCSEWLEKAMEIERRYKLRWPGKK